MRFFVSSRHGWQILRDSVSPYVSSLTRREHDEHTVLRHVVHLTRLCLASSNLQLQLEHARADSGTKTWRPSTLSSEPRL